MINLRDMFTVVYPSDGSACGSYRMIFPGEAARNAGKLVSVMSRPPQVTVDQNNNVLGINVGNANVVVFQRAANATMIPAIQKLQDKGVAVVIDMDDSLSKIDPRNPVHKNYNPTQNHKSNHILAQRVCDMADHVTVTTEALAEEYGTHGRVSIIPNHVPARYLKIPRPENEVPIVTWAGWTAIHPGDLHVTGGMINRALVETGAAFMAFGDEKIFGDLKIRAKAPNFHRSFANFADYPRTLALADIGIIPLRKTPFNKSKSWLKALEMASVGIVPVASPTPDNLKFAELGGCLIAKEPAEWHRIVKELIQDNDRRCELSAQVRKVASTLTYEDNYNLWIDAWAKAREHRNMV